MEDMIGFIKRIYWKTPSELKEWNRVFHTLIPGEIGEYLRMNYYKKRFKRSGPELHIATHVTIYHPENIEVGDWVQFSRYSHINASGGLKIGTNSGCGPYSKILTANHNYNDLKIPVKDQGWTNGPITIGENVWIGTGVIILPGVTIGDHTVIGGGTVVTKDVPAYSVCVGNPGKVIGSKINKEVSSNYDNLG